VVQIKFPILQSFSSNIFSRTCRSSWRRRRWAARTRRRSRRRSSTDARRCWRRQIIRRCRSTKRILQSGSFFQFFMFQTSCWGPPFHYFWSMAKAKGKIHNIVEWMMEYQRVARIPTRQPWKKLSLRLCQKWNVFYILKRRNVLWWNNWWWDCNMLWNVYSLLLGIKVILFE